jgi:hypothetical protein
MASNCVSLDIENYLKMGIVNGKAVETITNVRSGTQVTQSKMGLIRLCSSIGVIVDTCKQAALY